MLDKLFESLRNDKSRYLGAQKGSDFEDRIMSYLRGDLGFNRILKSDVASPDWNLIKATIGNKLGNSFLDIPNENLKKTFIYQPYGSQAFPDFIIFTDKKVIPLEVKFSAKESKPIWNSNVPRAHAFYIFGSYGLKDITFFSGEDVITPDHRKLLYGFFKDIKAIQDKVRQEMPALDLTDRGFTPYIRAAFDQRNHKKTVATNFFKHPQRIRVEDSAINKAIYL
jgi:hypothetical protein